MLQPPVRWHTTQASQEQFSNIQEIPQQDIPDGDQDSEDDHDTSGNTDNWIVKAGLLGASNSATFIQSICRAVGGHDVSEPKKSGTDTAVQYNREKPSASRSRLHMTNSRTADYVLPPRNHADQLLAMHWACSHIPWIDRLRIVHWYEGLWSGSQEPNHDIDEQIYYCILNVIFAISYIDVDSPEPDSIQSQRLSQIHFGRAQRLMSFNLLDISHIGLVQALLVMIQYFQSTNMIRQCFQCTGLAILIAQNLGLHLPHTTARIRSQYDREMARRAWHGCVLVDRITSMIYSQPLRIPQEVARNSPLPAAIDEEYLEDGDGEGFQPPDKPSRLQFFRIFSKLHIILGDILCTFYAGSSQIHDGAVDTVNKSSGPDLSQVMQFDKTLNDWLNAVDPHLRLDDNFQAVNSEFKGQALNLYARFLNIRLLLYRTFFSQQTSALLEQQGAVDDNNVNKFPPFTDAVILQGLLTCVQIAQQLLQLISSNINKDHSSRYVPAWWHVTSYVYSGVTILIAAHLFPKVVEHLSQNSLEESIQAGFRILEYYTSDKKPAQRCKAALTVLHDKMIKATTTSATPKQTPNGTVVPPQLNFHEHNNTHGIYTTGHEIPTDFAWADIIGATDLFSSGDDFHWLNSSSFDHDPSTNLWS